MPKKRRTTKAIKRLRKDEPLPLQRIAEMRDAEERFSLLVEGTPDYAMFLLEPKEGLISYWSSGAEKVFGWSAKEALGARRK
ncbi:MAG: PAS domain-containing protein [Verrucomicrobiota bacterium]|nr:PAS domain-containing protein [Verrucomicrobiota bacterium]